MTEHINADLRFSIIPEWLLDSDLSDRAIRVYSVLARYADNETLQAYPSRDTLAQRCHCHWRSVDRAIDELVRLGAITKTHRKNGDSYQSNLYTLRRVLPTQSGGTDTTVRGVVTPQSVGTDTGGNLTITTELEPDNYIEKKAKRATSIPDPFALEDTVVDALRKKHPSLDIGEQIDAFVDFHTAKGSVFKDWDAAFRTWCRNAVKFAEPRTVIHKQALKPAADGPGRREWVRSLHDQGEHFECKPGEFGCK